MRTHSRRLDIVFPEQSRSMSPVQYAVFKAVSRKYTDLDFQSDYRGPVSELGLSQVNVRIPEQRMRIKFDDYPALVGSFEEAGLKPPYFL